MINMFSFQHLSPVMMTACMKTSLKLRQMSKWLGKIVMRTLSNRAPPLFTLLIDYGCQGQHKVKGLGTLITQLLIYVTHFVYFHVLSWYWMFDVIHDKLHSFPIFQYTCCCNANYKDKSACRTDSCPLFCFAIKCYILHIGKGFGVCALGIVMMCMESQSVARLCSSHGVRSSPALVLHSFSIPSACCFGVDYLAHFKVKHEVS